MDMVPLEAVWSLLCDMADMVVCEPLCDCSEALGVVEHVAGKCDLACEIIVEGADVYVRSVPLVEEAAQDRGVELVFVCGVDYMPDSCDFGTCDDFLLEQTFPKSPVAVVCTLPLRAIELTVLCTCLLMRRLHVDKPHMHCVNVIIF